MSTDDMVPPHIFCTLLPLKQLPCRQSIFNDIAAK